MTKRSHEERDEASGRYVGTERCDLCGKPVGTDYMTDGEVCGTGDGPGFYLCERRRCVAARAGLSVETRRAAYEARRFENRKDDDVEAGRYVALLGVKVLQGARYAAAESIRASGREPDAQGYEDGSTAWAFLFDLPAREVEAVRDLLWEAGHGCVEIVWRRVEA